LAKAKNLAKGKGSKLMTNIDPYSLTTAPLEQCANGNSFGTATGFIWRVESSITTRRARGCFQGGETGPEVLPAVSAALKIPF